MKKVKSLSAVILVMITVISLFSTSAFAEGKKYELEGADITINVPEGAYVFSPSTEVTDPLWQEAGITDPAEYKTTYNELNVIAHFSMNSGRDDIYLARKQTDTTSTYYSLADLSEEQLNTFLGKYNIDQEGTMTSTSELYSHSQVPFIKTNIHSEYAQKDQVVNEVVYFTIVNGYSVSVSAHSKTEVSAEVDEIMRGIVDSMEFTKIIPNPVVANANPALAITVLVGAAALLVGVIVFFKVKNKRRHDKTKRLADKLSAYRKLKKEDLGAPQFTNNTDHNPQAIRQFSKYQAYHKAFVGGAVSIALTVIALCVSIYMNAAWWLTLILAAAALFCLYKFFTGAGTIEKALIRVYGKLKSTKAHYEFFEQEFTVSGMQSKEVYPYFQITDIRECKGYIYLYFGEGNTYFVSTDGFESGTAADFKAFITTKREKI